jgi:hypothetical protein
MSKYQDPLSLSRIGQSESTQASALLLFPIHRSANQKQDLEITGTRSEIFGYQSDSNHLAIGGQTDLQCC